MNVDQFETVLAKELEAVQERRRRMWNANQGLPPSDPAGGPAPPEAPNPPGAEAPPDACCSRVEQTELTGLAKVRKDALDMGLVGLAFSGGGIRSGSVCLGFLQGLAKNNLLRVFDYLSTVSGGGYAGAWFAAWVYRENLRTPAIVTGEAKGLENVEMQLDPSRVSQAKATRFQADASNTRVEREKVFDQEPEPVHHVRAYSNYLTPRGGLLSTDTWTLLAIYLRNTFANLLVLIPALFLLVIFSRIIIWSYDQWTDPRDQIVANGFGLAIHTFTVVQASATLLTVGLPVLVILVMLWNRAQIHASSVRAALLSNKPKINQTRESSNTTVLKGILLPIVAISALAVWAFSEIPGHSDKLRYWQFDLVNPLLKSIAGENLLVCYTIVFAVGSLLIGLFGMLFNILASDKPSPSPTRLWEKVWNAIGLARAPVTLLSSFALGMILGASCFAVLELVVWNKAMGADLKATLGPPLFMTAFVIAGFLDQWLFSRWLSPHELEWRSRVAAAMLMAAVVWLGFFAVTLYLPSAVLLTAELGNHLPAVVVAGWASTIVGAVFAARNPRAQPGATMPSPGLALLARLGPILFLLGLLALLSLLLSQMTVAVAEFHKEYAYSLQEIKRGVIVELSPKYNGGVIVESPPKYDGGVIVGLSPSYGHLLVTVGVGCGLIVLFFTILLDVNVFSLHSLWGNRLIRTFLAASRRKPHEVSTNGAPSPSAPFGAQEQPRQANAFTGFDSADDVPLASLRPPTRIPWRGVPYIYDPDVYSLRDDEHYDGPYPIFNTSLNLMAGQDLAFRDRLAASFVLTPYYCGSDPTGFLETPADEVNQFNLTLGRAMTISGAAADPNMPLQSSAQVALLTVLNARMGWWMQNPRAWGKKQWAAKSPKFGVIDSLFREALGLTDAEGNYIHLSDGGHFDNSGVYELIRRRCRFVVAVDAAEDTADASENLAAMIRQVRTDLGIRIEIDTSPLRKDDKGLSKWHVAVGLIRYDDVDQDAAVGTFFFIRSSLTGDEPADLKNYAARDPRFPHHPTITNQFFDETLFESYRSLGYHLADSVFIEAAANFHVTDLTKNNHVVLVRRFFATVRNRWFPPPPEFNRNYLEAGKSFAELMHTLRTDSNMSRLTHDAYPEIVPLNGPGNVPRAELLAVNHVLDVMEMAWLGIDLTGYYAHPLHSGWMGVCRRWAASETFQRYWPVLRGEYCKDFVRFCEQVLNLPRVEVIPIRPKYDPDAPDLKHEKAWRAAMKRLNDEFLREWADTLSEATDAEWQQYRSELKRYSSALARGQGGARPKPCPPAPVPISLSEAVELAMKDGKSAVEDGTKIDRRPPMVWFLTIAQSRAEVGWSTPRHHEHLKGFPVGVLVVYPVRLDKTDPPKSIPTPPTESPPDYYEVIYWVRGPYRSLGLGRQALEFEFNYKGKRVKLFKLIVLELESRFRGRTGLRLIARFPITGETSADRLQRALWANLLYDYDFRRAKDTGAHQFMTLQLLVDTDRIERIDRETTEDHRAVDGSELIHATHQEELPEPPPASEPGATTPPTNITLAQVIAMHNPTNPPAPPDAPAPE